MSDVWKCDNCGKVKLYEEEITCWKCGRGEMHYHRVPKGFLFTYDEEPA